MLIRRGSRLCELRGYMARMCMIKRPTCAAGVSGAGTNWKLYEPATHDCMATPQSIPTATRKAVSCISRRPEGALLSMHAMADDTCCSRTARRCSRSSGLNEPFEGMTYPVATRAATHGHGSARVHDDQTVLRSTMAGSRTMTRPLAVELARRRAREQGPRARGQACWHRARTQENLILPPLRRDRGPIPHRPRERRSVACSRRISRASSIACSRPPFIAHGNVLQASSRSSASFRIRARSTPAGFRSWVWPEKVRARIVVSAADRPASAYGCAGAAVGEDFFAVQASRV